MLGKKVCDGSIVEKQLILRRKLAFVHWKSANYHMTNLPGFAETTFLEEWMIVSSWNLADAQGAG